MRLRSAEQFASVSDSAARAGVSMNEWILGRVEDAGRENQGSEGRSGSVHPASQSAHGESESRRPAIRKQIERSIAPVEPRPDEGSGGDEAPVNPCPSCEEPLVASGGKLYCANQACGICGQEQKVRRAR